MVGVTCGDLARPEILAQHAFAGTRLLNLGDDASLPCRDFPPQGPGEVSWRRSGFSLPPDRRQGLAAQGSSDLLALDRQNSIQDVSLSTGVVFHVGAFECHPRA